MYVSHVSVSLGMVHLNHLTVYKQMIDTKLNY